MAGVAIIDRNQPANRKITPSMMLHVMSSKNSYRPELQQISQSAQAAQGQRSSMPLSVLTPPHAAQVDPAKARGCLRCQPRQHLVHQRARRAVMNAELPARPDPRAANASPSGLSDLLFEGGNLRVQRLICSLNPRLLLAWLSPRPLPPHCPARQCYFLPVKHNTM